MSASTLVTAVVDATFNDVVWAAALRDLGAERAYTICKQAHADVGLQIAQRADQLAALRDSEVSDDEYNAAKADYHDWHRRATHVRRSLARRLAEVKADAIREQSLTNSDRSALLRLGKRLWLREQGQPDHLDTALDDLQCSYGGQRLPLRDVVERLVAGAEEVRP